MSKDETIHESDLTLPTLRLLADAPKGFLETSTLIERLEAVFNPVGKDNEIIDGRGDTYFSQKVRNIVSHRESPNNPICKGWIKYVADQKGLMITDDGRKILQSFIRE